MHFSLAGVRRRFGSGYDWKKEQQSGCGKPNLAAALVLLAFLFGAGISSLAQSFTAAITGTVTDASGGVISGAKVEIRNTGTNELRVMTSDANGLFTAEQLPPGQYQLTVTAAGFKAFVKNGIVLVGSQRAEHDAQLQIGSTGDSIEVSAGAIAVDTQTANREVTISEEQVQGLPTGFRNPLWLVQSTAGVVSVRTALSPYTTDQNQNRFALNGGRDESSAIQVDGASIVAPDLGGAIASPTQAATQEVQIQRTAYDAQFTHTDGGAVSLITKSGTNQFHGSAFEYLQNSIFNANGWGNNHYAIQRAPFHRHQFGGSFGGRVKKDKLFFFGAYEGLRQNQPQSLATRVPTDLERQGDFSASVYADGTPVTIYNPFDVVNGKRQPFPGNKIPSGLIDAVGKAAVALFPEPNSTSATGNNFATTVPMSSPYDKFDLRGDWIVSPKDTFFVRITKAWQVNSFPDFYKNAMDPWQGENDYRQEIIANNTWIPSPSWVINTEASYGKWTEVDTSAAYGHSAADLGLPASTVSQFQANAYPEFNVENYATLGLSNQNNAPHETDGLQVNISHELRRHSLKFGFLGEIQRLYEAVLNSPNFNFNSGMTAGPTPVTDGTDSGNSIASLLLGTGNSGNVPYQSKLDLQQLNFGLYVQDTWRVNDRLTVTAGLRWDDQNARTERYNRLNTFDPTATTSVGGTTLTGGLVFATPHNRGLWEAQHDNFDPRVSVAYKINSRLVGRAGFGIFNPSTYSYSGDSQDSSDGYSANTNWLASVGNNGLTPQDLVSNPFPNGLVQPIGSSQGLLTLLGNQIHASMRHHPTSYAEVYSADLQYQVSPSGIVEVGYAGSQGRQLHLGSWSDLDQLPSNYLGLGYDALNAPVANPYAGIITDPTSPLYGSTIPYWRTLVKYPQFSSVQLLPDTVGASSHFNALTLKYNQRFSWGFNALVTYQWSKAIDNTSENNGWEVQDRIRDTFNLKADRSISAHDIPSSFVGTFTWDLPFGRGKLIGSGMGSALNEVVGGWKLNTILRFNDGKPLQLTQNNNLGNYNYQVSRPNITSASALKAPKRSINQWFNTAAVTTAGTSTTPAIGNAPRYIGSVRWGAVNETDMALEKDFPIYREYTLKFRAEAYSLTNTPAYGKPDIHLGDSGFGQIGWTDGVVPRTLQFGMRLDF
jgi:hypothetical protein